MPKQNFAFDAQQFGEEQVVTMLTLYRGIQSLIHGGKRLVELTEPGKPGRESTLKLRIRRTPSGWLRASNASFNTATPSANCLARSLIFRIKRSTVCQ